MAAPLRISDQPINILIVDDEPKNLTVLETVLNDPGYRLVRAGSADQALLALVGEEFALLILDIRMPGMTGFELAQIIKERKKTAGVPIIFLTAYYNEDQHVIAGYGTGAVDYLHKPVNSVILRSKVAVFAALHRNQRAYGLANVALLAEVAERRRAEEQLRDLNENLEQRVTERAEALRASEERFRVLFDSGPVAIFSCDRHAVIQAYNRRAAELWGREPECGSERHCGSMKLFHADGRPLPHEESPILGVLRTGVIVKDAEVLIERPDGSRIDVAVTFAPLKDESGEITGAITAFYDITERRRNEAALRLSEARKEAILTSALDAIITMDHEGRLVEFNPAAERIFGHARAAVLGKVLAEVIIPERLRERHRQGMAPFLGTGEGPVLNQQIELPALRADGTEFPAEFAIIVIPGTSPPMFTAFLRDITQRKRAEAALREAKDAAVTANQSKDRFLAVLSHELRTPLTPVLMTISALEHDPGLRPDVRQEMARMKENLELETKLIDDLLDVSRIANGKVALKIQPVDLNEAVRQACGVCRAQLLDQEVRLEMALGEGTGTVAADSARLQQVLWNVFKNAIKFSPPHRTVHVSTARLPGDRVEVRTRDTGLGIPGEMLSRIFDAFEQGDPAITRQFGGLGLGLAISKALVELHGGSIRAESEGKGRGATFVIELPVGSRTASPAAPAPAAEVPVSPQLKLLVVEDHRNTARTLRLLLSTHGYTVTLAHDVATALDLAGRQTFDLVITDLGLPDGSGYDVRAGVQKIQPIPALAISGYGMEEDLRRSRDEGFVDHLVKPFEVPQLLAAIERAVRPKS